MVRAAAKNHPSVAVVVDPARYDAVARGGRRRRVHPGRAAGRSPRRPSATPRPTTSARRVVDGQRRGAADDEGTGLPGWLGRGDERARGGRAPLRREPAPGGGRSTSTATGAAASPSAEQLHGKEMSYNNYVDADAAVARGARPRRARRRDHQAREPVRHRGGGPSSPTRTRRRTRATPSRAYGGVIAANRRRDRREAARPDRRDLHRGRRRPRVRRPRRSRSCTAKKNLRLLVVSARPRDRRECRRISGGLLVQQADRVDAPGDDPRRPGPSPRGAVTPEALADLDVRVARVSGRSSPTRFCWPRTGRRWASAWVRSIASTRAGSRCTRAGEERARGSVAASDAFFPFADGLAGAARRGRARGRPAGRVGARRRGHRRGRGRRRHHVPHRHAPLLPLTPAHDSAREVRAS